MAAWILLLRDRRQLVRQRNRLLVVLRNVVDLSGDVVQTIEHHLFGDLFLVEEDNLLDRTNAALQVLADRNDLANDDWRTRQRFQYTKLPALDALGDLDFAFTREQRHRAHLAQIHADGVVG